MSPTTSTTQSSEKITNNVIKTTSVTSIEKKKNDTSNKVTESKTTDEGSKSRSEGVISPNPKIDEKK